MTGDDAAYIGQADAGAFKLGRGMQALEDTEKLVGIFHVEARSVVADEENPRFLVTVHHPDLYTWPG